MLTQAMIAICQWGDSLQSLADFPATVCRVKTLVDGGIRIELDLPETEAEILTTMHNLRGRYLRVVVYDDDEFRRAVDT